MRGRMTSGLSRRTLIPRHKIISPGSPGNYSPPAPTTRFRCGLRNRPEPLPNDPVTFTGFHSQVPPSMTIAEINSALQAHLPTIVLSPATFGQDGALTPVLQQFFPETSGAVTIVKVANYRFDAANGVITFSGTGQGGPFDNMAIDPVMIKATDNVIEVAISA